MIAGAGVWLNVNSLDDYWPLRVTTDNQAFGNWYTAAKMRGSWDEYHNNVARDNTLLKPGAWPAAARQIADGAGIQKGAGSRSTTRSVLLSGSRLQWCRAQFQDQYRLRGCYDGDDAVVHVTPSRACGANASGASNAGLASMVAAVITRPCASS